MQIQLKQVEIEEALKQYISQQGIILAGKNVTIEFTSGRKDNGLSAEIDVETVSPTKPLQESDESDPSIPIPKINPFK